MSLNDQQPGGGQPTPPSLIDPEEYARAVARANELEAQNAQASEFFERLRPHADRVRRMLEDEDAGRVFDDSITAYDTLKQQRKPKLGPEWDPDVNPYIAKLNKLDEVYDTVKQFKDRTAEYEAKQANERVVAEHQAMANKLIEQYPHLAENNYAGVEAIVGYSVSKNVSFEDAAKRLEPVFRTASPSTAAPSLRPGVGEPGVPGGSESTEHPDMVKRAAELIRFHQKAQS